ncbi:CshA/CshB family fibrillar adhesin-related protein [Cellulomonas xiejunii]|uniref:CshA/CshB family fibrillar adhesin-related protein n=1 Tax=Cellulomonas xiejunii TaxID=2968083 RepID=A0ABY5KJU5_9CELL|nr:CshA/CshB family fibrillar adhesin-related protein [Cellulomonas xiejunii]MCC2320477.1 CshA/CshB family fibrillar adhesin-related protein [Cellulomonas xiejunii]UUI70772.1 CshA/CshB family fibrillar adhesin-related protein [Cellulomonas xiejunii]
MHAVARTQRGGGARRAALGAALALVLGLGLAPVVDAMTATPAAAAVGDLATSTNSGSALMATEGAGRYKDRIVWINWGTPGQVLPGGASAGTQATTTVTTRQDLSADARLEVACTMTRGHQQDVDVYRPGTWTADGLPQLYRTAQGAANNLIAGFRAPLGTDRDVTVSCVAELATYAAAGFTGTRTAQTVPLAGLVVADAESTKAEESIRATGTTATTWRVIDRYAGTCGTQYRAAVSGNALTFSANGECPAGQYSATAVALAQGATTLNLHLDGSAGQTAAAVGYVLGADYGDAAETYGHGPAVVQPTWTAGTTVGATVTNVLAANFTLATMAAPATRLGAQAFPNRTVPHSADATGDTGWAVPNGTTGATTVRPDEDAFAAAPRLTARVGVASTYTLSVACTGGRVRGWLDWNANGVFNTGEQTNTAACTGGATTLTWSGVTVTASQLGLRTLRVAAATTDAQLLTATTPIVAGEVEDWQVTLTATVRVTKTANAVTMPAGGTVRYTVTVSNAGAGAVTAYLVDDYAGALDDATLGTVTRPAGSTFTDNGTGRFAWSGTVAANGSVTLTYDMTMRSSAGGPGDQVLTNVVAVSTAAINGGVTCVAGSDEQLTGQCARVDLYRPGMTIDKQAYRATDLSTELASGVELAPGTAVVWHYVVRNTGSVPLAGVVVSDTWSQIRTTVAGSTSTGGTTTLTCPGRTPGTSVDLGTLAVGATVTCTATGTVVPYP